MPEKQPRMYYPKSMLAVYVIDTNLKVDLRHPACHDVRVQALVTQLAMDTVPYYITGELRQETQAVACGRFFALAN